MKKVLFCFLFFLLMAGGLPAMAGDNVVVHNNTPFVGEVFAGGAEIAELATGGIYADYVSTRQYYAAVPLMVFFFRQTAEGRKYVGLAARILPVYDYNNFESFDWEINPSDIITPDGRAPDGNGAETPYRPEDSKFFGKIPVSVWGGTTNVQIGNNSGYAVRIFVDGREKFRNVETPGLASLCTGNFSLRYSIPVSIQIDYLKHDGNGGLLLITSKSAQIWLNPFGIHAYQIIIGPPNSGLMINGH